MSGFNSSAPTAAERHDPLVQMSVHSLPSAPQADLAQRTRMGRLKMLMVWAICAAPVVASYFTYYVVRPQGRANYGTLIQPPREMPADAALPLRDAQDRAVAASSLKGQWLLVTVAGGACDQACEQHLYYQRQVRETLGKDKDRIDRVWFVTDEVPVREAIKPGLQGTTVLRIPSNDLARWFSPEPGQPLSAHFYLVDPKGAWMMRFPAQADMSKVKRDLSRLMKASDSWDEAGR
ncbi:SCO family protein [Aquabacterium sp.]|uniref:SCO family protein n=1 Tax=Aquabacterium sp. TaxID=1872578 RepID=UPI003D6CCF66